MQYYQESDFYSAKKQRNKLLTVYFIIAGIYLALSMVCLIFFWLLPYGSNKVGLIKFIHYTLTAIFTIFSFLYLGLPFKRMNKYYKMNKNIMHGLKETSRANFIDFDNTMQEKDGVDFKSIIFLQWNEYKKKYFERKVLVFFDKEYPEFKENDDVTFTTQSNVLVSYEINEKEE